VDVCSSNGPIIITRNGKPVAVLLAPKDEDDLDRLMLARSPRFQALLDKSRRSIAAGKGISRDEFWKAVKRRRRKK
jgi:PHD/YefM family antitoxin component YafN of YafNO toxin-antitoxin module